MNLEKFKIDDFDQLYDLFKSSFVVQTEKDICKSKLMNILNNKNCAIYVIKEEDLILGAAILIYMTTLLKKQILQHYGTCDYNSVLSKQNSGYNCLTFGTYVFNFKENTSKVYVYNKRHDIFDLNV